MHRQPGGVFFPVRRAAGRLVVLVLSFGAALCMAVGQAQPVAAAPVALLTDLDGQASVQRADGRHRLEVLDTLAAGDELRLGPNTRVEVVVTADRDRVYTLNGPGRFLLSKTELVALDRDSAVVTRDLVGNWRTLQLQPGMVGRASVSLRGAADAPLVTRSPVGGQRSRALDVLRWNAPYGRWRDRWSYTVAVIDVQGRPVYSATATTSVVPLPRTIAWLRGRSYVWTVAAVSDDGRRAEGSAEFHIVDQDVEDFIDAAQDAAAMARRKLPPGSLVAEDVLLALVLDQAGLRNEADRQWRSLVTARPAFAAWGSLAR